MFAGFTFDFHTPWINGMAKHMIKNGLRALINPATRNLVINHHGKVFELKAIAPIIAGVDLVFLIVSPTEYAVWKIEDEGVSLVSFELSLEDYIAQDYDKGGDDEYPSVCKSNRGQDEHRIMLQSDPRLPGVYPDSENRYGILGKYYKVGAVWEYVIVGYRSTYEPEGWSSGGAEVWNSEVYKSDANYLCSGRRPFIVDSNGDVLKNLEFWETAAGVGQIEYDDEDGHKIGDSFSYSAQNDIYAVLDKDKIIGVDRSSFLTLNVNTITSVSNPCCSSSVNCPTSVGRQLINSEEYDYRFGSVTLETILGYWFEWNSVLIELPCPCTNPPVSKAIHPVVMADRNKYQTSSPNTSEMVIMDYDNINVDETFICFYAKKDGVFWDYNYLYLSGTESNPTAFNGYWKFDINQRVYWLVYRLNSGTLQRLKICTLDDGAVRTYAAPTYSCVGPTVCPPTSSYTQVSGFQGQRIRNVTCQATEKYLLYSYTLQTYNGPLGQQHWNDGDDVLWDFDERILGIIDIATGTRTEHEVNNSLLGDLYKDTFDEEKASAVGLHRR